VIYKVFFIQEEPRKWFLEHILG